MKLKIFLAGLVLLIGLVYGGTKTYIYLQVSDSVDSVVLALAPYAKIEYGGISSTLSGELTVDDVSIQVNEFRDAVIVERMGIKTPNFLELLKLSDLSAMAQPDNKPPEYFGLIATGIRLPVSADYLSHFYQANIKQLAPPDIRQRGVQCVGKYGHSPRALRALGYEELVISMSVFLRQAKTLYTTEVNFGIVDMLDVEVEVKMAGDVMSAAASGSGYQPLLHSMMVKITDKSLNQRITDYCTELGLTPAQILRAHLNALEYFGSHFGIKFDNYVIDPYKEFLAGKPTLITTARPRSPLRLAQISRYKPSDVPALLNLEAVAQ